MSLQTTQRIHIAPQGYDQDRIYEPAIETDADLVYLLVTEGDDEQSVECQEVVESELEEAGIDYETEKCNIFNPDEAIQTISSLIREHSDDDVKVNISTGSKITAISGMFACMMYGASPYYVQAEDYGEETVSVGVEEMFELPAYPIEPPEEEFVKILGFLKQKEEDDETVKIKDLNSFIQSEDLDGVKDTTRKDENNIYDIANDAYIQPMMEQGHIQMTPIAGSKRIQITEKGKRTLEFSEHLQ